MESGTNKKLKVVWICHFTNDIMQKILKPKKRIAEFAPWISLGIKEAKKRNDIELYVVSPHQWIIKDVEFKDKGVHYYFFNTGMPFYGRRWPAFFQLDIYTNYYFNKSKVKHFINKVKPDIIHLHGLENAYYSTTILQFVDKYPIITTIQGFISLEKHIGKPSKYLEKRIKVERDILVKTKNFGVRTNAMQEMIYNYNPKANLFWHEYFLNIPKIQNSLDDNTTKIYDLLFFARIAKEKGVEDLIVVTGKLKNSYPDIKVAIVGRTSTTYLAYLKEMAADNNCVKNIDFLGFQPTQEDVYKILLQSKICVLPTYNDTVPGTIIESMFRRIPVVSYKTGGIPDLNEKEEVVLLSEQGNINGLYNNIKKLLNNPEYSKLLAEKAYKYATIRWNNKKAMDDIIKAYKTILNENHASLN